MLLTKKVKKQTLAIIKLFEKVKSDFTIILNVILNKKITLYSDEEKKKKSIAEGKLKSKVLDFLKYSIEFYDRVCIMHLRSFSKGNDLMCESTWEARIADLSLAISILRFHGDENYLNKIKFLGKKMGDDAFEYESEKKKEEMLGEFINLINEMWNYFDSAKLPHPQFHFR